MAQEIKIPQEAGPKYKLIKEIKESPLYKNDKHSAKAYEYIRKHIKATPIGHAAIPGQLIVFEYKEPKTKEELKYYDSSPSTLFFGYFRAKDGLRILGFNIHYYPPKMRFQIMNKIFEMYKPIYSKYFDNPLSKEIDAFDYKYLMEALKKGKLDFGVREYIPELCGRAWKIPANMWSVAVFTEGHFRKDTRENILNYWKNWKSGYHYKDKQSQQTKQHPNKSSKEGFFKRLLSRFKRKK